MESVKIQSQMDKILTRDVEIADAVMIPTGSVCKEA